MQMAHGFARGTGDSAVNAKARALLIELESAHAAILQEGAVMQAVQDQAEARPDQWAHARWKLSQASRRRRAAVDKIYPLALAGATATEGQHVSALQADDPVMQAASRKHVGHWTPERISVDWAGYCAASTIIRRSMTDRIKAEQDILIPILKRLAGD